MYTRSAPYYDKLYHFKDYDEACGELLGWIAREHPNASSLLDLACGTGQHLARLAKHYTVAGLDINPDFLTIAEERVPTAQMFRGDMSDFHLDERFDVITCLFSSIGYVKTLPALYKTLACIANHLNPEGIVFVEPWFTPETYWVGQITANFVDEPDLKIARMYLSERHDKLAVLNIHYMVGTPAGVEQFDEKHEIGLFTHDEYVTAFQKAGLDARFDKRGLFRRGMYLGRFSRASFESNGEQNF